MMSGFAISACLPGEAPPPVGGGTHLGGGCASRAARRPRGRAGDLKLGAVTGALPNSPHEPDHGAAKLDQVRGHSSSSPDDIAVNERLLIARTFSWEKKPLIGAAP